MQYCVFLVIQFSFLAIWLLWPQVINKRIVNISRFLRGKPIHGHRSHVLKISKIGSRNFLDRLCEWTDRQTYRHTDCNTLHAHRGRSRPNISHQRKRME